MGRLMIAIVLTLAVAHYASRFTSSHKDQFQQFGPSIQQQASRFSGVSTHRAPARVNTTSATSKPAQGNYSPSNNINLNYDGMKFYTDLKGDEK